MNMRAGQMGLRKRALMDGGVYHVVNKVAMNQYIFEAREQEMFRKMMWKHAEFCGVEVLSYCLMSNHVHLLVRVPEKEDLNDDELIRRYKSLYSEKHRTLGALLPCEVEAVFQGEEVFGPSGLIDEDSLREQLMARMGDLSVFVGELKQRFCIWYNKTHEGKGTMWAQRFRSTLIEDCWESLSVVAAYIDLNPIRAGMVEDPAKYRFSSYGAACGGCKVSQNGYLKMTDGREYKGWGSIGRIYNCIIYGQEGVSGEIRSEVLSNNGVIPLHLLLRRRVAYFTEGLVLGSSEFIQSVMDNNPERFGKRKRRRGVPLKGGFWGALCSLKNLQL